ncbi:unnamed protein product [Brassica rapa subsp. trilocularis]
MLFRGWDPGILGDSRTRSGVYRKDTIIRIWIPKGILEKSLIEDLQGFIRVGIGRIRDSPSSSKGMRNPEDLVQDIRGTVFVFINARPPSIILGIWVNQIRLIHYDEGIIGLMYLIFGGFLESLAGLVESGIMIFRITDGGYCIHGLDSLRGDVGLGNQYKRDRESIERSIKPSNLFLQKFNNLFCSLLVLVRMSQSQLLGNGGDMKNGEGNRKRLKISDNSDLIKSYSKTLRGRCMNPMEQDVKALLVTGVVLLEFCDHFRLYNGNIGVGVCSGTWLEIWIDWLGQCIMRLAPKLVSSNQLQKAELEMNRALGFGYLGKQVVERVWFKVAVVRSVTKVLFMVCSTKEMAVGLGSSGRLWYKFLASWSGLTYSTIYFGHGSPKGSRYGSNVLIMVVRLEKCTFTDVVNFHNPIKNIEDKSCKIASWLVSIECTREIKVCYFIRELTMLSMVCDVSFDQYRFIIIIIRPRYVRWQCCSRCVLLVRVINYLSIADLFNYVGRREVAFAFLFRCVLMLWNNNSLVMVLIFGNYTLNMLTLCPYMAGVEESGQSVGKIPQVTKKDCRKRICGPIRGCGSDMVVVGY